jgi:hypothetical protein
MGILNNIFGNVFKTPRHVPILIWFVGMLFCVYGILWILAPFTAIFKVEDGSVLALSIWFVSVIFSVYVFVYLTTLVFYKKGLNFFTSRYFRTEQFVIFAISFMAILFSILTGESVLELLELFLILPLILSIFYTIFFFLEWLSGYRGRRIRYRFYSQSDFPYKTDYMFDPDD